MLLRMYCLEASEQARDQSREQTEEDKAMTAKAPNILIVMADQMAPAFLPIYGHALTRAPHMQELARSGVVFDSAYCASPLCSPSRASFMAGRLPSRTRVYDNAAEFAADIPTFAHHLRRRGYRTILSGKMHFCGPDQLHGFEERLTTDIYPADFGWTPDWSRSATCSGSVCSCSTSMWGKAGGRSWICGAIVARSRKTMRCIGVSNTMWFPRPSP